ncbi:hypothetical protein Gpo141_00002749 [Globisporangium polare]
MVKTQPSLGPEPRDAVFKSSLLQPRDEWWRSRVLVGTFVVLLHALACVYYAAVAKLHLYIQATEGYKTTIESLGSNILSYFDAVIIAAVLLAVVHALAICSLCWRALPRRHAGRVLAADTDANKRKEHTKWAIRRQQFVKNVLVTAVRWDHNVEKLFGVGSYELLVVVEVGLQTFQAFKLSHLVATPWINRLMVSVIVANCWFIPVVSVVFRKRMPTFVKVVHLAFDSTLEIVYGMAIPLAIFYPYFRDANHILHDNPFINFYMDTWFINAFAENKQIYVTSWIDFLSKMAPGVSLFLRLFSLQSQRAEHETRAKTASDLKVPVQDGHNTGSRNKKRVVNSLVFLIGLGLLVVHLAANVTSITGSDPGCLLEMTPLGSTQYACAVLEVSCTQKHITGTKSELDNALRHVDPASLQGLIFSHCESLSMPLRIKTFPKLVAIKIHNCSIEEWSDDAALTAQAHPVLQTLYLTMTNMSQIPDGLLSPSFPPTLSDIEFCGTNLTGLPMDLSKKWSMVYNFMLELSPGITEFPPALYRADAAIPVVSLASNGLTTLPADMFIDKQVPSVLFLSGNPLIALPEQVGATLAAMHVVAIAFTSIAEVPASWMPAFDEANVTSAKVLMPASTTPLCDKLLGTQAQPPSSGAVVKPTWLHVECSPADPLNKRYFYPLEMEKQWRQANRA